MDALGEKCEVKKIWVHGSAIPIFYFCLIEHISIARVRPMLLRVRVTRYVVICIANVPPPRPTFGCVGFRPVHPHWDESHASFGAAEWIEPDIAVLGGYPSGEHQPL